MTIKEFKRKLAEKHTGQFYRQAHGFYGGCIRHKTLKFGSPGFEISACPLAVIFGDDYLPSAKRAGMSVRNRDAIMDAADHTDNHDSELRDWMLETLCTSPAARP